MPGVGVGGLISNLVNPGLDDQIGAAVTPNPNPLAQQGQPAAATSGSPNMPNAAATKQDPVSANLASLLLKRQRQAELAADFNQNIQGVAAGFGTAQQQASKQAALHGGGGGAGGGIGDVGDIMNIQKQVQDQNQYARFHANMRVLAQILGLPDTPEGVAQASEIADNNTLLEQQGQTVASNKVATPAMKDADAATRAYADANPNASPQDIARFRSNLLSSSALGGDSKAREYMQAKQAWFNDPANKDKQLPPELTTQAAFEATQAGNISTAKKTADDLTADKHNFEPALGNYDKTISALDEFMKPDMQEAAKEFLGTTGQYNPVANMSEPAKKAWSLYKQIMGSQFSSGVQDFKGAGRITQQELNQDLPSQSTMNQLNQSPEDFATATGKYRDQLARRRAGLFGAAQQGNDSRLSDEDYAKYVAPNLDITGGPRRANDFSKLSDDDAMAKIQALPSGAKFIGPDGAVHTRK